MSEYYYDAFDCNRHSEEINTVDPDELNEVNRLMAEPEPEWEGYGVWSEEVEAKAWEGAQPVATPHGEILIKKACEHKSCPHTHCLRSDLRLGGIAV